MLDRLLCFYNWTIAGFARIRDAQEKLIPLRLNLSQRKVFAAMIAKAEAKKPVRVIVPKARKHGVSTLVQAINVYLCAHYPNQRAVTIAHEGEATDEIFAIAKRVASGYILGPQVGARKIDFDQTSSLYSCQTAGGTAVGAGGSPNLLHLSEVAKWEKNKDDTERDATNAVMDTPTSIIVYESTIKGRDLFWRRFDDARRGLNSYIAVFLPWYFDERCVLDGEHEFEPTDDERGLVRLARTDGVELSLGQLAWRRQKIADVGLINYRQEYPSTPEEAAQAATGMILPNLLPWIVDELPFDPQKIPHPIGGIDFGFADPTVVWTGIEWDRTIYLVDHYRRAGAVAEDHASHLWRGSTYYCDPASLSDRKNLGVEANRIGMSVKLYPAPRHKKVGEDVAAVELQRTIKFINDGRLRIFAPIAEQLLIEAQSFFWNEKTGKPDDTRTDESGHYDSIMALKYLVMGVYDRLTHVKQSGNGRASTNGNGHVMTRRNRFFLGVI